MRSKHHVPILLVVLLALALQLYGLESKSLWFDELATLTCAGWRGGLLDAIRNPLIIPTTPKPPLPFVITHLFLAWDGSVFALRLPSVLWATLAIPLVYVVGKSLFDRRVGFLAAFLLAIAPFHVRYAQEARMYSMLTFSALLSLYLFWRAIRSDRMGWWLAWTMAVVLSLYVHLFSLLTLAAMSLFALWLWLRPRARVQYPFQPWHFLLALTLLGLLYLPMAPYIVQGLAGDEGLAGDAPSRWTLPLLLDAARLFNGGNDPGVALYSVLFLLAVVVLAIRRRDLLFLTLLWMVLPAVIVLATPFGHAVRLRYFIFALPVYLVLVAYGLDRAIGWLALWAARRPTRSASPWLAGVLLLALGGLAAPSLASYYAETKQDWREATWLVGKLAQPGDTIYVTQVYHREGVLFYASHWPEQQRVLTDDSVRLLPDDPVAAFPLSDDRGHWLIVPLRDKFLPGGDLDVSLAPYHQVLSPTTLAPARVPREGELIGPTGFRPLALVQVTATRLPVIRFWVDDRVLASGGCTWLRWDVQNVDQVYLDGQGVVGHGEQQICPVTSADHVLKVIHLDGTVTLQTLEVLVAAR